MRRIPDADTARDGKPLAALHLSHVVSGDEVTVTVGLAYGQPSNTPVLVTTVKVAPGEPAVVDALRAFGVEPLTLSIGTTAASMPYPPVVSSPSSVLEAHAELVAAKVPGYRIVLTNRSPIPLTSLRFEGYRAATRTTTAADGLIEGSVPERDLDRAFYTSRERYVSRLLDMLRGTSVRTPAELVAMLNSLGTSEAAARQVEEMLVKDLEAFHKEGSGNQPGAFAAWMGDAIRELEQWRERIRSQLR